MNKHLLPSATLIRKPHRLQRPAIVAAPSLGLDGAQNEPAGYLTSLAHEVRNPLCNIDMALEMLRPIALDEEATLYLDIIRRASVRIKNLITTLLITDHSREDSYEYFSLHQLLDEVLAVASDRMLLKKVVVSRKYYASEHRAFLNREHIKIALSNIVTNAIDAMAVETGKLALVTNSTPEQISLEIHDNGIGIGKENLKRIFEPFFTNKPNGLGLGLSTTLEILRANHTKIDVRSQEGLGTCFTLSFKR
jgi:signal transduction histidine kinase